MANPGQPVSGLSSPHGVSPNTREGTSVALRVCQIACLAIALAMMPLISYAVWQSYEVAFVMLTVEMVPLIGYVLWRSRKVTPIQTPTIPSPPSPLAVQAVENPPVVLEPVVQVAQKVEQVVEPILSWKTAAERTVLIERSENKVDIRLLQFLLNDYVGGGRGHSIDRAVDFLKHYLQRYLSIWPQDVHAAKIYERLDSYVYRPDPTRPLQEVAAEFWLLLEKKEYLSMGGGFYDGDGGGHALFYEFFLLKNGTVAFTVTNSGMGLEYHIKTESGEFYRTLSFSGARLQDLKDQQFLELLVSFTRTRPPLKKLEGVVTSLQGRLCGVTDVYVALLYGWPGEGPSVASNPGKQQRASSCSVQALMKWVKRTCDSNHHPWLVLWVKLSSFSDYLDNNTDEHSAQFITDAVRKMSSHLDKMDQQEDIPAPLLEAWQEISARARLKRSEALIQEAGLRSARALSARESGWGLDLYEIVSLNELRSIEGEAAPASSYYYPHAFPGEPAPVAELPKLAQDRIAPLFDEMAYRLNMVRLLPFCTEWGTLSEQEVVHLGRVLQLFFYMDNPASSIHVPDSFLVDLLNAWMGIYLVAKNGNQITQEVLLEWMNGASLLIETYTPEYRFDSPQARKRWDRLGKRIKTEVDDLNRSLDSCYRAPPNYWTAWDKNTRVFNCYSPFTIPDEDPILKLQQLPAMARFARTVLQSMASVEIPSDSKETIALEDLTPEILLTGYARRIERWDKVSWYNGVEIPIEVTKAIDAFGCTLFVVPHYEGLRRGLATLFALADRHLGKGYTCGPIGEKRKSTVSTAPEEHEVAISTAVMKQPEIYSVGTSTTRFKPCLSTPECLLAKTEAQWRPLQDLNQRVRGVLLEEERQFPFMTAQEEQELLIFVQKDPVTHLSEMVVFFRKYLHKLSLPPYQATFEYLLFSKEGGERLEQLFAQSPASISLLFHFFESSYDDLLTRSPNLQTGAAALFHSHLRVFQLSCLYGHPEQPRHLEQLLQSWERLIQAGQKNPILGRALGEAVFAALPALEYIYPPLLERPEFLQMLTTTCLLECIPADYKHMPYSRLQLHYGWLSFNALLRGCPGEAPKLWQQAAQRIFGSEESATCHWDSEKNQLRLNTLEIDLAQRCIEGSDEFSMRLIPPDHRDYQLSNLFGRRNFFAHARTEGSLTIYAFTWKQAVYEWRVDSLTEKKMIYKQFGREWYQLGDLEFLPWNHYFKSQKEGISGARVFVAWRNGNKCLIERAETREIVAGGTEEGLYRYAQGKPGAEVLVSFDKTTVLHPLFDRLNIPVLVWADPTSRRITLIEMPQLQLEFHPDIDDQERVHCINFPGFFLAQHQQVTFLKNFCSALILENAAGQKKVIVPILNHQISEYQPFEETLLRSSWNGTGGMKTPHPYLTFDIEDACSHPVLSPRPCNQVAITWLLVLYLKTREYEAALNLIEETRVTAQQSIQPLAKTIRSFACDSSDTHPHAVALRLRLHAWNSSEKELDLYENLQNAMGRFALSAEELAKLRARCKKNGLRFHSTLYGQKSLAVRSLMTLSLDLRQHIIKATGDLQPTLSLTVPGEDFILNFLNYLEIIRTGSETKKNCLRKLLYYTWNDSDPLIAMLSRILVYEDKITDRTGFPDLRELFELDDKAFEVQFEKFKKKLGPHLAGPAKKKFMEGPSLSFPGSREHRIRFYVDGESQSSRPRAAHFIDEFQPLPAIGFQLVLTPLPFSEIEGELTRPSPVDLEPDLRAADQLANWATSQMQEDAVLQGPFDRLSRGAAQLREELKAVGTEKELVNLNHREAVLQRYSQEIGARSESLARKEHEILEKANNLHNQRQLHLEVGRELRRPFDIETLLIALGRNELTVIRNGNPSLSEREITEIMQEVLEYAALRADLQHLKRAEKSLAENPEEYISRARATRCYNPAERPELLVFEVLSDLILRKEQVDALQSLTPGTLFEARTGFGKSKVLLPLWLLLTAQESLAILISPATLFDEQDRYLQQLLHKAYRYFAISVEFSRESPSSAQDIAFIEGEMRRAERLKRPVLMSDQTAHNLFILKLKELSQIESAAEVVEALLRVRSFVKDKRVYIDEPHKVLDDRQEFNYSIGMPVRLPEERLQFETHLYTHLLTLIKGRFQVEFWPEEGLPSLTEEIYRKEFLHLLLENMIQATDEERRYLRGELNLEVQQKFERELANQEPKRATAVRLLHDQLHHFLPQTIQRNCDEHYALASDRIAIPLEDARNPREGNEFVSIDQMLNFTIQANLKTPLSDEYIFEFLQELEDRATGEAARDAIALKETQAYRQFVLLTQAMTPRPPGLMLLKPVDIMRIHAHLNKNFEAKLLFILIKELPKVRQFHEKVSSTPHLLVKCFDHVVGASGTLSMQHFPHSCQVKCDERAIARTVATLLKHNAPVIELSENASLAPLAAIQSQYPEASVLIEVGAILRQYPDILQIAEDILRLYPQFGGVATFDSQGHPVVATRDSAIWIPVESAGIPRSQLFWFYGQKDTTGRDEKVEKEAVAVVLVNQFTTLTHLVQGVGRMRGILNGQRAKIVMDHKSAFYIRKKIGKAAQEPITLLDLIGYCALQEGEGNGVANFRSLSLQLDALVESFFWDGIVSAQVPQEVLQPQLAAIHSYIFQSTKDEPLKRPSMTLTSIAINLALEELMTAFRKKIEAVQQLRDWTLTQIDTTQMVGASEQVQKSMPYPKVVLQNHILDSAQVVETTSNQTVDQQASTVGQQETLAADETETISAQFAWSSVLQGKEPLPRTKEIVPHPLSVVLSHPCLKKYLPLFATSRLHVSQNALCTFTGDSPNQPGWINGYIKPLHYIAQLLDGRYVLIDTDEAGQVLKQPRSVRLLWLVNHGPLIAFTGEDIPNRMELEAKWLNGDQRYNPEQQRLFDAVPQEGRVLVKEFTQEFYKLYLPVER